MITVHHLENSRSQRILWLLEELGLPYEVVRYERDPKTLLAPPSLKPVHPLGKSPVIEDQGRVIAETGAIVEYLVEKAEGRLGPPANRDSVLRYRQFLHYAEASMMPPLFGLLIVGRLGLDNAYQFLRSLKARDLAPDMRTALDETIDEYGDSVADPYR